MRNVVLPLALVAALLLAGATRQLAQYQHHRLGQRPGLPANAAGPSRLTNLNSFSLALLLGGLRGPLVMFLWTSSENQKNEKNLEDIDTKIEMIRLLQPEFDSVHLFQIWNKAYNLSVQMASLANKYATVLDALDYAHRVDRQRPDNLNISTAIASLYGDKFGNSAEKSYYTERISAETLPWVQLGFPALRQQEFLQAAAKLALGLRAEDLLTDPASGQLAASLKPIVADQLRQSFAGQDVRYELRSRRGQSDAADTGQRPTHHPEMLDRDGHLLPSLVRPDGRHPRPAHVPPDELWNDGSELQYLKKFDAPPWGGFPYGLSPYPLAYNYYKRAQVLQRTTGQKHLQFDVRVIETRPAVALRRWSEEELTAARRLELEAFALDGEVAREAMEMPTASLWADKLALPALLPEAIFRCQRSAALVDEALVEYENQRVAPGDVFDAHRDLLAALKPLAQADGLYLQALRASPSERQALLKQATEVYQRAINGWYLMLLKYYVEDDIARAVYPQYTEGGVTQRYTKSNIHKLDPRHYPEVDKAVVAQILKPVPAGGKGGQDMHASERGEYMNYIQRATARQAMIRQILAAP
jgi:hypothetical protein